MYSYSVCCNSKHVMLCLQVELMSFHLCTVSFVTDVEDILVIMVKRDCYTPGVACDQQEQEQSSKNKISCHVLQAPNVHTYCVLFFSCSIFITFVDSYNGIGNRPSIQCGISRVFKEQWH